MRVVRVPQWVWTSVRRIAWHPVVQLTGSTIAPQLFWRFTLIIDNSFWVDTTKLQSLWQKAPIALDDGLLQMMASVANEIARLM